MTPRTTRVGPQTGGRIVYTTSAQKGAFWELPGGDVLTSLQTARTSIRPGVAIYDLEYRLRRISGARVVSSPNNVIGVCRDDGTPRACHIGPDADGPSGLSLVTREGAILLITRRPNPDGRSHLAVVRLDPSTGMEVPVAEYPELRSARADRGIEPHRALRSLGAGQTVLTAEMVDQPPRTLVLATDGAVVARADGFALGDRWDPFSVLLSSQAFPTTASFRWWNARTGAVTPAYALPPPPAGTSQSFRGLVAPSGDLLFHDYGRNHRLIHVAPDGRVVEDRPFAATSVLLGALASGAYLAFERSGTSVLNGSLRARVGADPGTLYYTDAMLARDAGWSPNPFGSSFPYLLGPNAAVIDDAGNAYVGFVLQTGGNTQTRVARRPRARRAPAGGRLAADLLRRRVPAARGAHRAADRRHLPRPLHQRVRHRGGVKGRRAGRRRGSLRGTVGGHLLERVGGVRPPRCAPHTGGTIAPRRAIAASSSARRASLGASSRPCTAALRRLTRAQRTESSARSSATIAATRASSAGTRSAVARIACTTCPRSRGRSGARARSRRGRPPRRRPARPTALEHRAEEPLDPLPERRQPPELLGVARETGEAVALLPQSFEQRGEGERGRRWGRRRSLHGDD